MEDNDLENKLAKDMPKILKGLDDFIKDNLQGIDKKLAQQIDPKVYAKWKAYHNKYMVLIQNNEFAKAEKLKKQYESEQV